MNMRAWTAGVAVLLLPGGCSSTSSPAPTSSFYDPSTPLPSRVELPAVQPAVVAAEHTVVYLISGQVESVSVTMATPTGTSQADEYTGREHQYTMATGDLFYISAQAQGDIISDITCTVTVDGLPVATNTSSGQFAVVSCHGQV